eukprot:1158013-Amphidinium_carterae.1
MPRKSLTKKFLDCKLSSLEESFASPGSRPQQHDHEVCGLWLLQRSTSISRSAPNRLSKEPRQQSYLGT